jgi:hypothetical protein
MKIGYEIAAAVLFVLSSGLLFSESVRASRVLFSLVGIVAMASFYVLTKDILDATAGQRFHHHINTAHAIVPAVPSAATPDTPSFTEALLQAVYQNTENLLDRLVRAGTGQASASVSADTVVGAIVGVLLAVLGAVSQIFSALFRRLAGAA